MEKIGRICSKEGQYGERQKLYKRSNKCNVRCSLKYYHATTDKELERRKNINIITEKKLLIQRRI